MSVARGFPNAGHFYSNLVKPVDVNLSFVVTATNGLGITSLKSNGYVRNVFMHTSTTPTSNDGYLNPNPASGYALIQLKQNFNAYIGGSVVLSPPVTGSNINISGSSVMTAGNPYIITAVGAVPAPHFSVIAVADSAKSLASKYFKLSDAFGNNYVVYNVVSGTGTPPSLTGSLANYVAVPVAFATNAANTAVATALGTAIAAINGAASFSTSVSSATVTVTSAANANLVLSPAPTDVNTGFTVGAVTFTSLAADWQSVGLPVGLTPTVGQSFIATATGSALGTGTVKAPSLSAVGPVQIVGDPNQSISNSSIASNGGAWLLVAFPGATDASTTTLIPTAPALSTVVQMSLRFDGSAVTVDGL